MVMNDGKWVEEGGLPPSLPPSFLPSFPPSPLFPILNSCTYTILLFIIIVANLSSYMSPIRFLHALSPPCLSPCNAHHTYARECSHTMQSLSISFHYPVLLSAKGQGGGKKKCNLFFATATDIIRNLCGYEVFFKTITERGQTNACEAGNSASHILDPLLLPP